MDDWSASVLVPAVALCGTSNYYARPVTGLVDKARPFMDDKRTAISELLHGQDGQVVVLLGARELEQRRLDPLDGVVRTCRPRQHRLEPGLAEAPVAAPRVQHA